MSQLHSWVDLDLCCEPEEDLAPSYGVPYTVHRVPGRFTCALPAVDFSILDTTDNEVHDVRRIGSVPCLERKGPLAPMYCWGFLWPLAGRHLLPPHPWPRHRTSRFERAHERHSIVHVQIDQHRSSNHTMSHDPGRFTCVLPMDLGDRGVLTQNQDKECCVTS